MKILFLLLSTSSFQESQPERKCNKKFDEKVDILSSSNWKESTNVTIKWKINKKWDNSDCVVYLAAMNGGPVMTPLSHPISDHLRNIYEAQYYVREGMADAKHILNPIRWAISVVCYHVYLHFDDTVLPWDERAWALQLLNVTK